MGQFLSTPQPTIISATANSSGVMTLVLSDGSSYNVQLPSGKDGISVTGATINSDGNLILAMSDGNAIDAGKINTTGTTTTVGSITPVNVTASGDIYGVNVNGVNVGASAQLRGQTVAASGNATVGGSLDVTGAVRARGNLWFDDTNHFANGDGWVRLWDKTGNYSKGFSAKKLHAAESVIIGDWTISQDGNGYLTFLRPNGSKVIMNPTNPVGVAQRGI